MSAPINVNPGSEGSMSKYNANETTETEVPNNASADDMVLEEERPSLEETLEETIAVLEDNFLNLTQEVTMESQAC